MQAEERENHRQARANHERDPQQRQADQDVRVGRKLREFHRFVRCFCLSNAIGVVAD